MFELIACFACHTMTVKSISSPLTELHVCVCVCVCVREGGGRTTFDLQNFLKVKAGPYTEGSEVSVFQCACIMTVRTCFDHLMHFYYDTIWKGNSKVSPLISSAAMRFSGDSVKGGNEKLKADHEKMKS